MFCYTAEIYRIIDIRSSDSTLLFDKSTPFSRPTTAAKRILAACSTTLVRARPLEGETVRVIECGRVCALDDTLRARLGEHSDENVGGDGGGLEYKSETNSKSSGRGSRAVRLMTFGRA